MKQLVIIPGGFHPFHLGHKSLYDAARKVFPRADIYIAATSDTSTRPFPFSLKKNLAYLGGVPKERFIEVKSPFQPREITQHYDPDNTVLIYVRSEKDRNTSPQPDKIKKNGEPSYLQSIHGLKPGELQPLNKHGYMAYLPTISFASDMSSSTEIRNNWPSYDDKQKSELIKTLYPATKNNVQLKNKVIQLFDQVLGSEQLTEKWSKKYKDSINCSNPKGFSQRAYCQGKKKKQNENVEHFSDDNLEYIGNCTQDEVIDEIFGNVNEFARLVDEYGDEFEIKDLVVKYDEDQDIHHFYWKQISEVVDKVKQIANPIKEDVYDVLDSESCGPFDGGCLLVAKALQEIHGGKIIVLVDDKNIAQHAAALLPNGKIADYDGAKKPKQFIKNFNKNELANVTSIRKLESSDLKDASKNFDLVPELVDALKSKPPSDYIDEKTENSGIVKEVFDKPGEIDKTKDDESLVRYDGFIEGDQLTVEFKELREGDWKIEFRVGGRMDARGDKSGKEIKIFATVIKAIREFVAERKPTMIVFTAAKEEFGAETGRARLYDRMVKRFASSAGYLSQVRDDNDRKIFVLRRIDSVDRPEE